MTESDGRRATLEALRDDLLGRMTEAADRDFTAMGRLLADVLRDLDEMPKAEGMSELDRFRARVTSARGAVAPGPDAPAV